MPINNLLVDNLLGVSGAGLFIFLYYYLHFCPEEGSFSKLVWFVPISVFCLLTKNSGILYSVIGSVWLLFAMHKKQTFKMIILSFSPYFALLLWKCHVRYVFPNAGASKHSMNISSYVHIFQTKDSEFILDICKKMLVFTFSGRDFYIVTGVLILSVILFRLFLYKFFAEYKKVFIYLICFYIVYEIGLLAMYIFSMPRNEAANLAQAARYRSTCFISIFMVIGLFSVTGLSEFSLPEASQDKNYKNFPQNLLSTILIFFMLTMIWYSCNRYRFFTIFTLPDETKTRINFQKDLGNYNVEKNKSYMLLFASNTSSYRNYLLRYLYYTKNTVFFYGVNKNLFLKANNYDYIFNYDDKNENVRNWIRANYPEQMQRTVIKTLHGIDTIDEYLTAITNPNHLVIIAVNDEAASNLNESTRDLLNDLGLDQDWSVPEMKRSGYIAVCYQGNTTELAGGRIHLTDDISDMVDYDVISAGFNDEKGPVASIRINGIEYSKNKRGFNIVVYDPDAQTLIDSVNFDTYLAGNPVTR